MPRAAREQLILGVSGQVFAHSGYHSASMDEIAERAGVSKPMLYAYFGSKEGLYLAYVERTGRELVQRLVGAARREDPPARRLRAPITEFLSFVEEYRDGWTVLFSEVASSRPLEDQVAQLRRQVAEAVRRMVEASIPPRGGPPAAASDGIASRSPTGTSPWCRPRSPRCCGAARLRAAAPARPRATRTGPRRAGRPAALRA
jgi:AcrR family transcriptional regulator